MQTFRLALLRARHDITHPYPDDDLWAEVITTGPDSLIQYWRDTLGSEFDLQLTEYPWVDSFLPFRMMATADGQALAAINAVRATKPKKDPVDDHDGFFVLTYPGFWVESDGVGGMVNANGPGARTELWANGAAVPVSASSISFAAHELGHSLGFDHTMGRPGNGGPGVVEFEYGSPYDMMSALRFGGTSPMYSLPQPPGWLYPNVRGSHGPHLSRAYLHARYPDALNGRTHDFVLQTPASSGRVRIRATGADLGPDDRTVLVLDPVGVSGTPVGRTYVELRVPSGWDRGIELDGPDEAVAGLAVHSIGFDGRVWYRGNVPLRSTDDDLVLPNGGLVIRLDDHSLDDPAGAWADVAWTTMPPEPSAWIVAETATTLAGGAGGTTRTTPCGNVVRWGEWDTTTTATFDLRTAGFGGQGGPGVAPPSVEWTVDGQVLTGTSGQLPAATSAMGGFVQWELDDGSADLTLTSPPGLEVWMTLVAEVTDGTTTVTATETFETAGGFEGVDPEQQPDVLDCLTEVLRRLPDGWPLLRRPDPTSFLDAERWRSDSHRWLDAALRRGADRAAVAAARSLVDLQTPRRVIR